MTTLTTLVFVTAVYWFLAFREARLGWWLTLTTGMLVVITLGSLLPAPLALLYWLTAGLATLFWGIGTLRRRWISAPLLRQFRRVLPPLTATEREALQAGSVWWDGELFSGRPDWQRLLTAPGVRLSNEEKAFIDGPVETLCRMIDDWDITHRHKDLPPEVWRYLREQGFFGMIIPRRYGGLEFSAYAHSQVILKLASRSVTAAVTAMVPNSLGPGKLLLHYGTEDQRRYYLPRLARGEEIPCFALTGPQAGSDAGSIPDRGVVTWGQWQGERVLGIRLNWEKRYITLGPVATLIGLAFRLYDPGHLIGDQEELGITVALIPRHTPGVEIGERHVPLDIPFQNGPNRGRDVFVPLTQIIGGRDNAGKGWRMLVECLAEGRGISLPSLTTAGAKIAARHTGAYSRVRRQFNQPVGFFEGVEEALARIAGYCYQMDAARELTLAALDCGEKPSVISAIVKYHLTERYRRVVNDAMDIHGGSGICLGPSNILGRAYQSVPIAITVEGANILTRSMIIFGQGAVRCHPWVLRELDAAEHPDPARALAAFDHALLGHTGFLLGNTARSLWLGITHGLFSSVPGTKPVRRWYRRLNWMSASFALCADVAMMTLGGSLKRRERLSARLGDVLSELYLASAVLKRFEDQGARREDLALVNWALEDGLYRIQESLRSLLRNLPSRPLAWLLRLLVFPTGYPWHEPTDRSAHRAARLLLSPSDARDRLTAGIFAPTDIASPTARIERAFASAAAGEPVERTLREARRRGQLHSSTLEALAAEAHQDGILDAEAEELIQRMVADQRRAIEVDAFSDYGNQYAIEATAAGSREGTNTSIGPQRSLS